MRRGSISVLVCLLGLWLGGCGEDSDAPSSATGSSETADSDSSESGTPTTPAHEGPSCEEVWVAGSKLPQAYRGCLEGETWVRAEAEHCASGQVLVTYADRYYAAKGAVVNDVGESLAKNAKYQQALRSCGG